MKIDQTLADKENRFTGWGDYTDTLYTSGSPFTLTGGAETNCPNNAGFSREQQKPLDVPTFYDSSTQKILGRNGDGLNVLFEFKAKPLSAASNIRIATNLDIGLPSGARIYPRDFILTKGNGVEHYCSASYAAYTLDTWTANGAQLKLTAINSDVSIYDIRYVFTRTHKAR